jgi:hypothetical protein
MSILNWHALAAIPAWTPLPSLHIAAHPISTSLFALGRNAYLYAVPYAQNLADSSEGPHVTFVAWAPSDGAALRAFEQQIESDDMAVSAPPARLLPSGTIPTYAAVRAAIRASHPNTIVESASYRIAKDGLLIHRVLCAGSVEYYFRNRSGLSEAPYSIRWGLQRRRS